MTIKILIVILFISLVLSLCTGLHFLIKDRGNASKRTAYALGVRVTLAGLLLATIGYGFATGQLQSKAPWDIALHPETSGYRAVPKPNQPAN